MVVDAAHRFCLSPKEQVARDKLIAPVSQCATPQLGSAEVDSTGGVGVEGVDVVLPHTSAAGRSPSDRASVCTPVSS